MYIYIYTQVGPNLAAKNHSISLNLSGSSDFPPQVSRSSFVLSCSQLALPFLSNRQFLHVHEFPFQIFQASASMISSLPVDVGAACGFASASGHASRMRAMACRSFATAAGIATSSTRKHGRI